jgi:hypothetical protein
MWSYYCAGHSGFVLGFSVEIDPAFFAIPLHVRYVKDYPAFQYLKEKDKIVDHGMVSKLDLWDHEREIRVIKKGPGLHRFDKNCLTEVIVGAKTTDTDRNRLIKYLRDYGYNHVQFKRAVPSDSAFQLRIENLTIP